MFALKPRIEVGIRVLLIAVIWFNALSPVTALANSTGDIQTTATASKHSIRSYKSLMPTMDEDRNRFRSGREKIPLEEGYPHITKAP